MFPPKDGVCERCGSDLSMDALVDAEKLRMMQALGAHIQADAYRDTFPDNEQDAKYLRKQETWWRLTGRSWLDDGDHERCAREAKSRVTDNPEFRAALSKREVKP